MPSFFIANVDGTTAAPFGSSFSRTSFFGGLPRVLTFPPFFAPSSGVGLLIYRVTAAMSALVSDANVVRTLQFNSAKFRSHLRSCKCLICILKDNPVRSRKFMYRQNRPDGVERNHQ